MRRYRWMDNVLILRNAVVGAILRTASGEWEAAGCLSDWMDTPLGVHPSRTPAKRAVEKWTEESVVCVRGSE